MKKFFLIMLTLGIFMSCKTSKNNQESSYSDAFESTEYELTTIEGKDVREMNLALRIDPENNRISGESGCNNYQFNYQLEETNLDLGYGVATKMYCQETMDIENAFFGAAKKVKHFKIGEEMIVFFDENGYRLIEAKRQNRKVQE